LCEQRVSAAAAHIDNLPHQDSALNAFNKLARTFAARIEAPYPSRAARGGRNAAPPDWIGQDELRQITVKVLINPREYEAGAANKRRGALIETGERREWRKKPHQPNEALDIVVGARALVWGESAGPLTGSEWRERAAAHGALEQPTLFTAPLVAPGTPVKASLLATQRDEIEQVVAAAAKLKAAAEAGGRVRGESCGRPERKPDRL
jgi:phage terminase large subunit GpA-like protein